MNNRQIVGVVVVQRRTRGEPAAAPHRPTVAYTHLWARLSRTERTTVHTLTRDGLLTGTVRQILTDTAGHTLFLPSAGDEHRLPQTFRLFLHAISAEHR